MRKNVHGELIKCLMAFDVDTGEVQDFQKLIELTVDTCEENDWFEKEEF